MEPGDKKAELEPATAASQRPRLSGIERERREQCRDDQRAVAEKRIRVEGDPRVLEQHHEDPGEKAAERDDQHALDARAGRSEGGALLKQTVRDDRQLEHADEHQHKDQEGDASAAVRMLPGVASRRPGDGTHRERRQQ